MTSRSTLVGKYIVTLTIFTLSTFSQGYAQVVRPKLKFIQPHLVSGTNVATVSKYSFNDTAKDIGSHNRVYYRINQLYFDGKATYTEIKMVRFGTNAKTSVQLFPNPYMEKST